MKLHKMKPIDVINASLSSGEIHSKNGDPQVIYRLNNKMPPNWYGIKLEINELNELSFSNFDINPKVYISDSNEFKEYKSIKLVRGKIDNRFEGLFYTSNFFNYIRLDPSDQKIDVKVKDFRIFKLSIPRRVFVFTKIALASSSLSYLSLVRLWGKYQDAKKRSAFLDGSRFLSRDNLSDDYHRWINRFDFSDVRDRAMIEARVGKLSEKPLISVIMPVYNTHAALLDAAINSVVNQVYPNWELCIANDASTEKHIRRQLEQWSVADGRIKVVHRTKNGHICAATNSAFELSSGSWVLMLDHDDVLRPHALAEVACAVSDNPNAGLIYSDEDKIDRNGKRFDPHFKPKYSPELFRSMNYMNHVTSYRADLVRAVGNWREGFEGSQDYDLNLRVVERLEPSQIIHIPKVLYHWRAIVGSTALSGGEKGYAFDAGFKALEEHLVRTGQDATVTQIPDTMYYRISHTIKEPKPLVSLIIPTKDRIDLLDVAISSILDRTTYAPFEIIVVDNNSQLPETFEYFQRIGKIDRVRVVRHAGEFNFSAINNDGVQHARGEIIGLINNDIEIISPDWLTEMVSWVQLDRVGCVGAKLYYPDETIQHAGVILGIGGVAGHSHKNFQRNARGYFNRLGVCQNLSAVTAACLLVRKQVFEDVGGLDEENLKVAFNDVDFCLKVREAGYENVWTPFAEMYHHESPSRGAEVTAEQKTRFAGEVVTMKSRWGQLLLNDPYYSPNLTLMREDFSIRTE